MKKAFLLFPTLLTLLSSYAYSLELQTGDVILLPLRCQLCSLIESETNSPYSHSGIVYRDPQGEFFIWQALKNVHQLPLKNFMAMKDPTRSALVLRAKELAVDAQSMKNLFEQNFLGAKFDYQDLWDNRDAEGRELYYCSEFVAKFLNSFLPQPIEGKAMNFDKNLSLWEKVYQGKVPQGEYGISPQGLAESPELTVMGTIY